MHSRKIAIALVLMCRVASSQVLDAVRVPVFTRYRAAAPTAIPPPNPEYMKRHCFAGCPVLERDAYDHGDTFVIAREGYVLEASAQDKIPLWVAERVSRAQLDGDATRTARFQPDPLLPRGRRSEPKDYRNVPFDRGHQAAPGNQNRNQLRKDETFFMSNVAPQVPDFNRQAWKYLETLVRKWVRTRGTVWVISGGFFYDPKEEDPSSATGVVIYKVIGPNRVAVPTHFFKIVIAQNPDTSALEAIAFVLANRRYAEPYDAQGYVHSIQWIEERTGIHFMPELGPSSALHLKHIEARVWPFK